MPLLSRLLRLASAVCLVGLIGSLFWAGQAGHASGVLPPPLDKVAHVVFWGSCAVMLTIASWQSKRYLQIAFFIALGSVAVLDEFIQFYTPGRSFELADIVASLIGVITARPIAQYIIKKIVVRFDQVITTRSPVMSSEEGNKNVTVEEIQ